jgi:putative membrane-bound dehydrogenase-like protein
MNPRYLPAVLVLLSGLYAPARAAVLVLREDSVTHAISVFRAGDAKPILTQNAGADFRPYVHPIVAPDGRGGLTEFSPSHHPHQTGLYWGFTKLNGRDYFHHPDKGYWRRVSSQPVVSTGEEVKWSTVYHLLDAAGQPLMLETQLWTMRDNGERYLLDLEWTGEALTDLTIGEHAYGGLFLRMPWRAGMEGSVNNNARQSNERANGQRAVWVDVGLKVEGRDDPAHIAILDHPGNNGYPLPWRIDGQLGVGPSRAILGDWKIPPGQRAVYRHQFVIYTGPFNDLKIDEAWKAYTGERMDSVLWNLAREEGKKATFQSGEQVAARMTVPAGLEVKLYAAEPAITQPMAFCWDDRGRLWVAENRDYESRGTGFSRSGDSRIVILEDTDGDGKMDTRKVFLEGVPFPAAIAWGFDGLWLGAPPNLLFVPDRNHDDRADAEIEVRLTGWGIQDRHETLNSLNWGPDGWLYGCQGYATRSNVGRPADGGRIYRSGEAFPESPKVKDAQYIDGGVWRYHPTKDRFEIVAHGFSNPWGLDFDDHGQMFITACVIPHLWHVIPGGIYHRQGGKHINPYVYDDIKTIADHRHRSAHGGARIYLADELPREYRGRIFMANLHERSLLTDILEPKGSGFVGHHGDDTLLANDPQWVGFSVEIGPDGAVYVLDWHDGDICGQSVRDKNTGRIFRLAPKGLAGKTGLNLDGLGDLELVELQLQRNDWYVRRARLLLQQRAAEGRLDPRVSGRLWEMFAQQDDTGRKLRALWALHVTKGLPPDRLVALLDHPAPYIRGWAVQLLGEDLAPGAAALKKFAAMAQSDPSPVVRLYLAAALQRLPHVERWAIAEGLLRHAADAADHNLPKMIWFAVEPLVAADPAKSLDLASRAAIPLVTQFIARRAVAAQQLEVVASALVRARDSAVRQSLLEGMRDGLGSLGRREITAPGNWAPLESELLASGNPTLRNLALQIGQLFGNAKAAAAQLAALKDAATAFERRRDILQSFAQEGYAPALPAVLGLLDDPRLRRDAIRALGSFDDPVVPAEILTRYAGWPGPEKSDAILTLAARRSSAGQLFDALKKQAIPKRDVSAFAARQLQRILGPAFVDFWGPIVQPPTDKQADLATLKRLLTDEALSRAKVANGRAVFDRTCAACHALYGNGGAIGPDLTGSNRANLDYILGEIINPSDVIQEGYQLITITTQDGRTLSGNLAGEDGQQVTLRLIGQETTIAKSSILSREKSAVSMMPEGLLKQLSSDDVRDLIAYLRTTSQVPLPKP